MCYAAHDAMKPSPVIDSNEGAPDEIVSAPNFRARKQQAIREIIWDSAIDLFVQNGYDETTVDDVAQAAGISQRSFFRYFTTKGDVMAYALLTYGDQLIAAIDGCPETYTVSEVFRETVIRVAQEALTHPRTRKVFEILKKSPAAAAAEMSRLGEVQGLVAKAFLKLLPESPECEFAAGLLAGITLQIAGVSVRWCFEHGEQEILAAIDQALKTLENVLCGSRQAGERPDGKSSKGSKARER